MTHSLKTDKIVFTGVLDNKIKFNIRKDDRDFNVGDELWLQETVNTGEEIKAGKSLGYTGRSIAVTVLHILRGPVYGLAAGWVIMSIERA